MWVAVGIVVAAAIGAGASYAASESQSEAVEDAANTAAEASMTAGQLQLKGQREAQAAQQKQYAQQRADFAPFTQPADRALATLQSSVYGEPINYQQRSLADLGTGNNGQPLAADGSNNPAFFSGVDSYGGATSKDLMDMVIGLKPNPNGYTMGDVVKATNAAKTQSTQGQSGNMTANAQQFDLAGLSAQQAAALNSFNPKETEAYRWQMKQGQEAIAKTLTMQGRGSGTVGTNAATKFAGDLNAAEYDKGYTRLSSLNDLNYNRMSGQKQDYQSQLLNLIKTAQGAAGTTSAAEQNFANQSSTAALNTGNNLSTLVVNQGNNQANAQLAQGQNTANLYSGLGQAAGTAAQGYAAYKGYKPNYNQTYTKTNGEFI